QARKARKLYSLFSLSHAEPRTQAMGVAACTGKFFDQVWWLRRDVSATCGFALWRLCGGQGLCLLAFSWWSMAFTLGFRFGDFEVSNFVILG
ncbi:hypothetical protein VIGAN_01411000, partial [Vigna angularis var. angularis]